MSEPLVERPAQSRIERSMSRARRPPRKGRATRWQRMLHALWAWLKGMGKLAVALVPRAARAEVRRLTAEARKAEAEARKGIVEADEIAARVDLLRLGYVKGLCDLADERFDWYPDVASALKSEALKKLSPRLPEEIARVKAMRDKAELRRTTEVQITTDPAALPASGESPSERVS